MHVIMRKLIEVFEKDNCEICFKTDLKMTDISELPILAGRVAFSMMTRLWGGNEEIILAVIRNLAIADLAVCYNRKEIISFLDKASSETSMLLKETLEDMRKHGCQFTEYAPGVGPQKQPN